MSTTLHATGVTFSHGARTVLHDVELTVAPGMRVGVLGPNGAGKSTLLGVLSGRLRPERGTVTCLPPSATVGELRQEPERDPHETALLIAAIRDGLNDISESKRSA